MLCGLKLTWMRRFINEGPDALEISLESVGSTGGTGLGGVTRGDAERVTGLSSSGAWEAVEFLESRELDEPSILHEDPRFYLRSTESFHSVVVHDFLQLARVVCIDCAGKLRRVDVEAVLRSRSGIGCDRGCSWETGTYLRLHTDTRTR